MEVSKILSEGQPTYVLGGLEEPSLSALSVGDGLLGGEGLGGHNEESSLGIADLDGLSKVRAVNVGDKVERQVALAIMLERLGDHNRAKVRSTDTNVDNGVDGLAGVTLPGTRPNGVRKLLHVLQHTCDLGNSLLLDVESTLGGVTKSHVQHSTVLGRVDVLAGKHLVAEPLDLGLTGQVEQGRENLLVDEVLRVVEKDADIGVTGLKLERMLAEPFGVGCEQVLENQL